jgi:thiamine biosynthesis lipoprotein
MSKGSDEAAMSETAMSKAAMSERATVTWEALGTSAVLRVTDREALATARAVVERELAAIDRACSRFREDSELSRVNAASGRRVRVEPLLVEALQVALRAAELTDGDVDPTLGVALELAGYDRDWTLLVPAGEGDASSDAVADAARPAGDRGTVPRLLVRGRVRAGWQTVELDCERLTIRVPAPIQLDLGATAKAWAADRAARAAARETGVGVLVSLGGDISTSGPAPAGGWLVRVTDDHRAPLSAPGQTITIADGGLATSSTHVRRWTHEGNTMHHIIDPQTQAPLRGSWRTASVAAADCVDANIASTAALIRADDAPAWLEEIGLPARLVDRCGGVLTVGDWPAELHVEHPQRRAA